MRDKKFFYIALVLLSSLFSIIKITLYSFYIGPLEFGYFSKAYVISSVFALVASLGLASIAHREVPSLFVNGKLGDIVVLNNATKNTIFFNGVFLVLLTLGIGLISGQSYILIVLGTVHGIFTGLFFQDLLLIKSKLYFEEYGKRLLLRTLAIMIAGLLTLSFYKSAISILVAECLILVLLQVNYLINRFKTPLKIAEVKKSIQRAFKNKQLIFLTLLSTSFIHGDKWVAAILLNAEEFGIYSFYWIMISIGLNLQQVLNIRIFTEATLLSKKNELHAYKKIIKFSLFLASALLLLSPIGFYLTCFVINKWFVEYSENVEIFVVLVYVLMIIRASDFISNMGLIFKCERYQVRIFLLGLITFVITAFVANNLDIGMSTNLTIYIVAIITTLLSLLLLALILYKRVKK